MARATSRLLLLALVAAAAMAVVCHAEAVESTEDEFWCVQYSGVGAWVWGARAYSERGRNRLFSRSAALQARAEPQLGGQRARGESKLRDLTCAPRRGLATDARGRAARARRGRKQLVSWPLSLAHVHTPPRFAPQTKIAQGLV